MRKKVVYFNTFIFLILFFLLYLTKLLLHLSFQCLRCYINFAHYFASTFSIWCRKLSYCKCNYLLLVSFIFTLYQKGTFSTCIFLLLHVSDKLYRMLFYVTKNQLLYRISEYLNFEKQRTYLEFLILCISLLVKEISIETLKTNNDLYVPVIFVGKNM